MKKFFSLIALVGVFAACQPEKIETTFDPDPAVATIEMTAVDLETGKVTTDVTYSAEGATVSGSTLTITGTPNITARELTVNAKFGNGAYSETYHINDLIAGGKATYSFTIAVGESKATGLEFVKGDTKENAEQYFTFKQAEHEGHATTADHYAFSHDGHSPSSWQLNNTEMVLLLSTEYEEYVGKKVSGISLNKATEEETALVQAYANALATPKLSTDIKNYSFKVSAWAYYNVVQTVYTYETTYTVNRIDENGAKSKIGLFIIKSYASIQEAVEYAANTHYVYMHGHGHSTHDEHGRTSNAGGGICYAD